MGEVAWHYNEGWEPIEDSSLARSERDLVRRSRGEVSIHPAWEPALEAQRHREQVGQRRLVVVERCFWPDCWNIEQATCHQEYDYYHMAVVVVGSRWVWGQDSEVLASPR